MGATPHPRLLVIGLDCAAPELVFERWPDRLPNLTALRQRGIWGPLQSCTPPITVPAWACMVTGKDPGQLGCYGFTVRTGHGYGDAGLASSRDIREKTIWDRLAWQRRESVLIGIPQTYPVRPINGTLVAGFPVPGPGSKIAFPDEAAAELNVTAGGEYIPDIDDYRTVDRGDLLARIRTMTERRFNLAERWLVEKPWDLFMLVEMGVDRIHHAFWRYFDERHRLHETNSPYRHAMRDYYALVDKRIGRLVAAVPPGTNVAVVSDHGARRMEGAVAINEWLVREGFLTLRGRPASPVPIEPALVDWPRTRAWGEGGYVGRVYLNVAGRNPEGAVPPEHVEALVRELTERLRAIPAPNGQPMNTRVHRPDEIYRETKGFPPDLIVEFDGLARRAAGSVGCEVHLLENDTGPDDANHDRYGVFVLAGPSVKEKARGSRLEGLSIYDVAPTFLTLLGADASGDWVGRVLPEIQSGEQRR